MSEPTSAADLGVYLHVPFCERVCPYCDFAVEAAGRLSPALARRFVDDLLAELELARRSWGGALEGRTLATVYFGGGTPGLLPAAEVERVLRALGEVFAGAPDEVTLELNPGVAECRRAPEFAAAGVTRQDLRDHHRLVWHLTRKSSADYDWADKLSDGEFDRIFDREDPST